MAKPEGFTMISQNNKHRHYCPLPGLWKRWRLGLRMGSVIECDSCHQRWVLRFSLYDGEAEWEKVVE